MSSKEEIKMYYVKSNYRSLYDNKFINNKASLPYWDGCGVDRDHIAGLEATVKESLQVQSSPAKDKANELVDGYMNLRPIKLSDYSKIEYPFAKQCALIVVESVISTIVGKGLEDIIPSDTGRLMFWREVKQEIIKL